MRKLSWTHVCLCCGLLSGASVQAGEDVELVRYMGSLQYMAHKTGLAIDGKNKPLADFYLHEIEEIVDKLEKIESYDGYAIATLVASLLAPSVERIEESLEKGDWKDVDAAYDKLLQNCNACHEQTEHAYIHIQRRKDNPYMQSFGSSD